MDYLRKIALLLLFMHAIFDSIVSVGYVYISMATPIGLCLGILMVLATLTLSVIIRYSTLLDDKKKTSERSSTWAGILLGIAMPCLILSTASSAISTYQSILLLAVALNLSIAPVLITVLAVAATVVTCLAITTYAVVQIYKLWRHLNEAPFELMVSNRPLDKCKIAHGLKGAKTEFLEYNEILNSASFSFSLGKKRLDRAEVSVAYIDTTRKRSLSV